MIWRHLKAIAWLQWRLSANRWRRGGSLNAIIGMLLLGLFCVLAFASFFIALAVGLLTLSKITADQLLIVWDVIVLSFLFMWTMGIVTELQRSEPLSLEKLLHLPVSPSGAYLLNYLSSWISLTLALFLPTAAGICLALVIIKGPYMLVLFPLLLSFVAMVTAVSHQFRGWLQVLMVNKRRRRTIIALVTGAFILLSQVPNLVNVVVQRRLKQDGPSEYQVAVDQLLSQLESGEIDAQEYDRQEATLKKQRDERRQKRRAETFNRVVKGAMLANAILPIGWLPLGARAAASASVWPGLCGTLGASLIAAASLWRSYRTTLRLYTGGFDRGQKKRLAAQPKVAADQNFLERRFSWIPEQATAVMLGGIRSMLRGPEGKMLLLTPLMLCGFLGIMIFWRHDADLPTQARPFLGIGAISMLLLCFVQALCNQFGFDRDGFRSLLLSPCPRRDILLGKNLAFAPLAFGMGAIILAVVQFLAALSFWHITATVVQLFTAYLILCLLGNVVSVLAPSAVAHGALKPAKAKLLTIVVHVVAALFSPLVVVPGGALLGTDLLVHEMGFLTHVPIYLLGSLAELGFVTWLYRRVLPVQGQLMQRREQTILAAISAHRVASFAGRDHNSENAIRKTQFGKQFREVAGDQSAELRQKVVNKPD